MKGDNVHPSALSFNVDDSGRFLPSDTELGNAVNCSGSVAKIEEITQILHHSQHLWPKKKGIPGWSCKKLGDDFPFQLGDVQVPAF